MDYRGKLEMIRFSSFAEVVKIQILLSIAYGSFHLVVFTCIKILSKNNVSYNLIRDRIKF